MKLGQLAVVVISFCIFHLCSTVLLDANLQNFNVLVYNCSKQVYGNKSFPHRILRVQKDKNESIIVFFGPHFIYSLDNIKYIHFFRSLIR